MGQNTSNESSDKINSQIKAHPVLLYCTRYCGYCTKAKAVFDILKVKSHCINIDEEPDGDELAVALHQLTKQDTVPCIFIATRYIGGFSQLLTGLRTGLIQNLLRKANIPFEDQPF